MKYSLLCASLLVGSLSLSAQKKSTVINDSNTPLHLLQPQYKVPYGVISTDRIKQDIDRVLAFLEKSTPARIVDKQTGRAIADGQSLTADAQLERGAFRLASYEWGVTYAAILAAAQSTGDQRYADYVNERLGFLAKATPLFKKQMYDLGVIDPQMKQILHPQALDDAGAMCSAMIKSSLANPALKDSLRPMIDNYMNYIMYHEYRLHDRTFARNRPHKNTVWLDDMFMSIPALANMGALTREMKYYNEATNQIRLFASRMFVDESNLFRHGWVEGMQEHPAFFWGRANGWAFLTLSEVLDVLPESHPDRPFVLDLFRKHAKGLAACQSGNGFWHQLVDRNDSYEETSATAIYVYGMAHGINKGWLDPMVYGPVAQLGWHAVSSVINDKGEVTGTCVGTGMGFDPAFYYYRPVNTYAAHGYGPVIWAGSEMIRMLGAQHPKMNDSAVQFYRTPQSTTDPIFAIQDNTRPDQIAAGSSRKSENAPVVFLIGDSTVKNGRGKGDGDMWGWGSFFEEFFDASRISVENHALGGRSSRTFYTEGLWDKVLPGIRKGDYLFIQFGHNDGGPLNTGRARASLKGTGEESETVIMERHGGPEEVFSYGHYLRLYIRQAKARGAEVIVLSHTPGNRWGDNGMNRCTDTYAQWSQEVAAQEGVQYIDLNNRCAEKYEQMGKEKTAGFFKDGVHTSKEGALLNGKAVVEGLRSLDGFSLNRYVRNDSVVSR